MCMIVQQKSKRDTSRLFENPAIFVPNAQTRCVSARRKPRRPLGPPMGLLSAMGSIASFSIVVFNAISSCPLQSEQPDARGSPTPHSRLMARSHMDPREHIHVTGSALKNWAVSQVQDSIAVALLWLVGLCILKVPWAPLWAALAAGLQIVTHLGPVLSLVGPVLAALFLWHDWEHPLYVLILYAVIVVVDGLFLQPYIMRRLRKCRFGLRYSYRSSWGLQFRSGDSFLPHPCWQ